HEIDGLVASEIALDLQVRMGSVEELRRKIFGRQRVTVLQVSLVVRPGLSETGHPPAPVESKPHRSGPRIPGLDEISRVLQIGEPEPLDTLAGLLADEARADVVLLAVHSRVAIEPAKGTLVDEVHRREGLGIGDARRPGSFPMPCPIADDGS